VAVAAAHRRWEGRDRAPDRRSAPAWADPPHARTP